MTLGFLGPEDEVPYRFHGNREGKEEKTWEIRKSQKSFKERKTVLENIWGSLGHSSYQNNNKNPSGVIEPSPPKSYLEQRKHFTNLN